jgi:hypothetical protein
MAPTDGREVCTDASYSVTTYLHPTNEERPGATMLTSPTTPVWLWVLIVLATLALIVTMVYPQTY